MRKFLVLGVFLLPAHRIKNFLMRRLGYDVHPTAHLGPGLMVNVRRFRAAEHAYIGYGNVFRSLNDLALDEHAFIGNLNWFTSNEMVSTVSPEAAYLRLGKHTAIESRHYVDCAGGVTLGDFAAMAGVGSVLLTHQVDIASNTQIVVPIELGEYALLNSCNRMVAGSTLPAYSVTAMGAVVVPGLRDPGRLYGGVPAKDIKEIDGAFLHRSHSHIEYVPR